MIRRLLIILLLATNAFAITKEERRQLGETLPYLLETMYVLPEKGNELAAQVRASFAKGAYDGAATPAALAEAITRDLSAANDRHLSVRYREENAAAPLLTVEAWKARMSATQPAMRRAIADPAAIRRGNFGVLAAEVLEGNVGYLKISQFMPAEAMRETADHAMAFLANTDAMIVDVRDCRGGSADGVSYLASYFFGPERRVLMNRYNRPSNSKMDSTTVDVTGARRPDTPLYILTNGKSASACESFAFTLQQWGRAKTVGEKTAGAGYNNMIVDVGLGLSFSISVGTATHPKTNKQFEAVGVVPDISVASDQAKDAARREALR
ncbi:MAG TPA: S41 family peptidase [Thermoanaerobaculia bacterium]|nr:S41 family peptidase [Thermoanaerobaculia bacterium]